MKKIALLIAILLMVGAAPAWALCLPAVDEWVADKAASDSYGVKATGMVLESVHMVAEAPVALLKGPYHGAQEDGAMGLLTGLGHGVANGVENIVYGAGNLIFALCPDKGPVYPERWGHSEEMQPQG